jgi:hypothetical protein
MKPRRLNIQKMNIIRQTAHPRVLKPPPSRKHFTRWTIARHRHSYVPKEDLIANRCKRTHKNKKAAAD